MAVSSPAIVGRLKSLCSEAVKARVFPGCVVGYIRDGRTTILPFGKLNYDEGSQAVTADTLYDVASVTKSIPTSAVVLKLIEDGRLSLDDPVVKYLPEMTHPDRAGMLVRHLLTYTVVPDLKVGLAQVTHDSPGQLLEVVLNSPLKAPPGELYYYTNTPAVLMGLVAEKVLGRSLYDTAVEWFFEPLGMKHSTFAPDPTSQPVAPTEFDERGEVKGTVHDEAAWALQQQGLTPGSAGLFSTAGDLLRYAEMLLGEGQLDGKRYFRAETVRQMHTNQLDGIGASAGLGWEIKRPDVMGRAISNGLLMKTGFTGCWVAVDPIRSQALVHLSNRTYPKRSDRILINAFWTALNQIFFGVPDKVPPVADGRDTAGK